MTIHGKFVGRLIERPKSFGPKKYGFTTLAVAAFDGSGSGRVTTVKALVDPGALDNKEVTKEARK